MPSCRHHNWNMCPNGHFLSGLERSGQLNGDNYLHNIEFGYCCKPLNGLAGYKDCFKANVWKRFNWHGRGMIRVVVMVTISLVFIDQGVTCFIVSRSLCAAQ